MLNLVTGGAGFIGTHLVRLLRDRGEAVRVLDLKRPAEAVPEVEYRQGTITDAGTVDAAVSECRRVFHLAAQAGLWAPVKEDFESVNVAGTRNVLTAARAHGVETVVHTSTESILIAVSGGRGPQVVDESTECSLRDMAGPYCRGKLLAEQEAWRAWREYGQRVIICNPTVPAGPGDHWLTPPSRMLLGFLRGKYPAYLPTTLNLVDARDVAEGHWLAATVGEPGKRYILGAHNLPLGDLLRHLQDISGVPMPTRQVPYPLAWVAAWISEVVADYITRRPPAAPLTGVRLAGIRVRFNNRWTRDALSWQPRPLVDTLRDGLADFRARGLSG